MDTNCASAGRGWMFLSACQRHEMVKLVKNFMRSENVVLRRVFEGMRGEVRFDLRKEMVDG